MFSPQDRAALFEQLEAAFWETRQSHRCPVAFGGCYCFEELERAIALLKEKLG